MAWELSRQVREVESFGEVLERGSKLSDLVLLSAAFLAHFKGVY